MNLTFSITHSFEKEFTTTNLVNSDIVIERDTIFTDKMNVGYCLMLDTINNMQERRQSPMTCINETYGRVITLILLFQRQESGVSI